ncbi:MAG: thiol reductant ABC exporter subunit CydD, partial [Anaerolineae bacterium]|nr:thiol reductant ABC exporter subunit CydD [Anaerolineae bacterium]
FLDVLQGLTTLKLFGRSRDQIAIIRRISERFRDTTMSVLRVAFLSALALEMLATLSTAIIAVEIGLRLLYGRLDFDEAFFILILAPEFYLPLRLLGTRFHAGMSGAAAAERIFAVLASPPESPSPLRREGDLRPPHLTPSRLLHAMERGPGGEAITFHDVHYAYNDGNRPALRGVTFAIPPRERIALVGPSGSGKSTAMQLLLCFLEPTAGRITVGDHDLYDIPADEWRARIAWVPQLPYLFAASVAENIRLACPDAPLDAVIRAAQQAHADTFIRALPDGYNTPIGEQGARLSGGQAQRIALARAFLKDAPLLLLDEATANLDPDTEALIQDAIRILLHDRTAVIIAHRLRTVQDADQIVVLDQGRVVDTGTHTELLARSGPYRRLVTAKEKY